jgi:hypothetical protein
MSAWQIGKALVLSKLFYAVHHIYDVDDARSQSELQGLKRFCSLVTEKKF